jgi:putrescine transport system substrate-binding protein
VVRHAGDAGGCGKHVANAHLFIDYLLRPEVAAANSNFVNYANSNAASTPLVNEEVRNDPGIYPTAEVKAKLQPNLAKSPAVHARADAHLDALHDGK